MVRRFGTTNYRVLLHLQAEIADLENRLFELDLADAKEGSPTGYRLVCVKHKETWDSTQRDLLRQLEEKLVVYCEW
jgi:hypothetical protein